MWLSSRSRAISLLRPLNAFCGISFSLADTRLKLSRFGFSGRSESSCSSSILDCDIWMWRIVAESGNMFFGSLVWNWIKYTSQPKYSTLKKLPFLYPVHIQTATAQARWPRRVTSWASARWRRDIPNRCRFRSCSSDRKGWRWGRGIACHPHWQHPTVPGHSQVRSRAFSLRSARMKYGRGPNHFSFSLVFVSTWN